MKGRRSLFQGMCVCMDVLGWEWWRAGGHEMHIHTRVDVDRARVAVAYRLQRLWRWAQGPTSAETLP